MFVPQPGFDFKPVAEWPLQFSLYADCDERPACWNSKKLDRAALLARYGPALLCWQLKRMLRCSSCGSDAVRLMFVWNVYYGTDRCRDDGQHQR